MCIKRSRRALNTQPPLSRLYPLSMGGRAPWTSHILHSVRPTLWPVAGQGESAFVVGEGSQDVRVSRRLTATSRDHQANDTHEVQAHQRVAPGRHRVTAD